MWKIDEKETVLMSNNYITLREQYGYQFEGLVTLQIKVL